MALFWNFGETERGIPFLPHQPPYTHPGLPSINNLGTVCLWAQFHDWVALQTKPSLLQNWATQFVLSLQNSTFEQAHTRLGNFPSYCTEDEKICRIDPIREAIPHMPFHICLHIFILLPAVHYWVLRETGCAKVREKKEAPICSLKLPLIMKGALKATVKMKCYLERMNELEPQIKKDEWRWEYGQRKFFCKLPTPLLLWLSIYSWLVVRSDLQCDARKTHKEDSNLAFGWV